MYCFNCMKEAEARGVCPHCHKQNIPDRIPHHLPPGTVLNGKYVVGNALGEGGFGITYVGLDTALQMRVAIKEYYPLGNANRNNSQSNNVYTSTQSQSEQYDKGKERFMREAQSVAQFSGAQGVVNIKNYFEENNTAYIIMEYLEGENLLQHINRHGNFSADTLFRLMLPMMQSLREIHDKHVIHRDISPDNIIIHNNTLTLTDFGSARYYSNQSNEMSVMLKQGYAPEEQYRSTGNQGTWTDVYGLCATIYKCITGVTPQNGLDRAHVDQLKPPSELGADISQPLEAVLLYGMAVYHNDRCQDMSELMDMTQNALNNRDPHVPVAYVPTDVDRTLSANDLEWEQSRQTRGAATQHRQQNRQIQQQQQQIGRQNQQQIPQRQNPEPQQSKAPVIAAVSIAAVAVVLAIVVLILMLNKNDGGDTDPTTSADTAVVTTQDAPVSVVVPDLTGKTYKEATAQLDKLELDYETKKETTDDPEQDNKVLKQDPKAGEKGSKVIITVGSYEPPVTEPITEAPETEAPTIMYCRASQYANLRTSPSSSATSIAEIPCRGAVEVLRSSGDFYYVNYNGKTGYVWKEVFSEDKDAPLYRDEEESSAVISPASNRMYCRASEDATLRSKPTSVKEYNICSIPSGESVEYLGVTVSGEHIAKYDDVYYGYGGKTGDKDRTFYKVKYDGNIGYVNSKFFSSDPNSPIVTDSW